MRIKSLELKEYKNLKNFKIDFESESCIDVLIGKNGTGKSNLFEAIIEIFRSFIDSDYEFYGDYKIDYKLNNSDICIEYTGGKYKRNNRQVKSISKSNIPDNILIYYSGHNERVAELVKTYEQKYSTSKARLQSRELRVFFGLDNGHKDIIFLLLMVLANENIARNNIISQLGIAEICSDIKITLQKPYYFDGELDSWDEKPFWDAWDPIKSFLENLHSHKIDITDNRDEGYFAEKEQYVFYLTCESLGQIIADTSPFEVFQFFDDLRLIGMLHSIDFTVKKASGEEVRLKHFSDGECQTIFFNGMLELFKDKDCLMLLDEPDAFLHPEWQFKLIKQIIEQTGSTDNDNHILLNTHNASTLVSTEDKQITLLDFDLDKIKPVNISKKEAVNRLSEGYIALSEDESKLRINNVIRDSDRPIIFVEGVTDVIILEIAYKKLKDTDEIPFLFQDAFNCGFVTTILSREEIFQNYPDKVFFGLYDFDKAYNDWRGHRGTHCGRTLAEGLAKELTDKKGFVLMLPVPDNELKAQVWDEENPIEKVLPNAHFTIEHMFWDHVDAGQFFKENSGVYKFNGKKVRFAKNIVPDLPVEAFESFRPMFDFIESKI